MNYRDISASEFKELINVENTEILDVRAPEEEEEGTIDGAKRINLMDPSFRDEIKALDRSKTYLVYCRSGVRGASACDFMASVGFASLYNLDGGIYAWKSIYS